MGALKEFSHGQAQTFNWKRKEQVIELLDSLAFEDVTQTYKRILIEDVRMAVFRTFPEKHFNLI